MPLFFLVAAAAQPAPVADNPIVVTASRAPVPADEAPASVTLFDEVQIEALGFTQASDLVRLAPGTSVSVSGGPGALAQVRIRGAEANHTLVFIDGIAFNDLAAGNQPRFETLGAEGLGRLELVRGPQSALWGSEALGGVIAVDSPDPLGAHRATASAEIGSRGFLRASATFATGGRDSGLSGTLSYLSSAGIDILGGGAGDLDGFNNLTAGMRGIVGFGDFQLGGAARYISHHLAYDGSDPLTFRRADTTDESEAETRAGRIWFGYGDSTGPWEARVEAQHLDSRNRNLLADLATNDSYGRRTRVGTQITHRFQIGSTRHSLIGAVEHEEEDFGSRDLQFGGATDRDLARSRTAFVGEWRAQWSDILTTDVALRHDDFSRFEDATTLRVHAALALVGGLSLVGAYGEGIAQPSFVDLFGFGPGSGFTGNPDLRPERSQGLEAGLRWVQPSFEVEAVAFSNNLTDEILEDFSIFPAYTVVNAPGESRRRGVELSGEWRPIDGMRIAANYTWLDTHEPSASSTVREIRRPEHTANLYVDWRSGAVTVGAALSYVGERTDTDFDVFPAPRVELGAYLLAGARLAYRVTSNVEAFARIENALDEEYQDVVGYATLGRSVHAGIRLSLGR